jgi:phospholipase C
VISPWARRHYVDHSSYDTTSILATIEHRFALDPLGSRDAGARDLRDAFVGSGGR